MDEFEKAASEFLWTQDPESDPAAKKFFALPESNMATGNQWLEVGR